MTHPSCFLRFDRYGIRLGMCLVLLILLTSLSWGQNTPLPEADPNAPVLKIGVQKTKFLPPAMYGTWNIRATVLNSTAPPGLYMPASSELWTLERNQERVTLSNIVTSATATIQVDHVQGNTATFHHVATAPSGHVKIIERPTVTVDGDKLFGMNRQEVIFLRKGKVTNTYHLEIEIVGERLSGAKVTFRDPEEVIPDFEVAPLQFSDH